MTRSHFTEVVICKQHCSSTPSSWWPLSCAFGIHTAVDSVIVASAERFGVICERAMWDIFGIFCTLTTFFNSWRMSVSVYPQSELGSFWHETDRLLLGHHLGHVIFTPDLCWNLASSIYHDPRHFIGILRTIRLHHKVAFLSPKPFWGKHSAHRWYEVSGVWRLDSGPNPQVIMKKPTRNNAPLEGKSFKITLHLLLVWSPPPKMDGI